MKKYFGYYASIFVLLGAMLLNANEYLWLSCQINTTLKKCTELQELYIKRPFNETHIQELGQKAYDLEWARLARKDFGPFEIQAVLEYNAQPELSNYLLLSSNINDHFSDLQERHNFLQQYDSTLAEWAKYIAKDELLSLISTTIANLTDLKNYVDKSISNTCSAISEPEAKKLRDAKEQCIQTEKEHKKQQMEQERQREEDYSYAQKMHERISNYTQEYRYQPYQSNLPLVQLDRSSIKIAERHLTFGLWANGVY